MSTPLPPRHDDRAWTGRAERLALIIIPVPWSSNRCQDDRATAREELSHEYPSYTPADDAKTQVFPAGPAFAPPAQEQAGNGLTDTSNGFTAEERAARAGRPVLSGAEQVSDDRSTWPHALADGMAVGSLILSLLGFGVIGIVLGAIHASNAHKLRQRASAVAAWGIGLGIAGTVAWALLIIVLIVAAASVGSAPAYGG